jgi:Cysteine dioxygenase type I
MTSLLLGSKQPTSRHSGAAKIAQSHGLLDGVTAAIDLAPSKLLAIAKELACGARNWPGVRNPDRRVWELIDSSQDFEAWVIGWPPGGAIELHDHGESGGAVVVAQGELVEMVITEDGKEPRAMTNTVLPESASVTFDRSHIHEIVNLGPGPAISVHVYAPRLTAMTYYDFRDGILESRATVRDELGTVVS